MSTRCSEGPRLTSEPQGGCSPRMGPALDLEHPFRPQGQLFQRFFPRLQPWAWLETLSVSQEGTPEALLALAAGALPRDSLRPL